MIQISSNDDTYKLVKYHDYFNIIALPIVILVNFYSFYVGFTPLNFDLCFFTFMLYITIDLFWILYQPKSVGHLLPIAIHHIICIIVWYFSMYSYDFMNIGRTYLFVEINTFFNILKRYYKYDIVYNLFYITWFLFRLVANANMFYLIFNKFMIEYTLTNSILNFSLLFLLSSLVITGLNIKWTFDLVTKKGFLGVSSRKE